jgi:hypothetical protein
MIYIAQALKSLGAPIVVLAVAIYVVIKGHIEFRYPR